KDLCEQEEPIYVALAVTLACVAMLLFLDGWLIPFVFLASIGAMILLNMGTNFFLGEISYITKALSAVLQLAVTMDYSIFLWHSYNEQLPLCENKEAAMASAIHNTLTSVIGSSVTTISGFIALCFMSFTLGRDLGIVMAKGVVLGVATVILVLPSLVLIFDKQITKHKHKSLMPSFDKVNSFILRHNKAIMVIFIVLFIPAYYAQSHAGIYYKLDESLPRDLPSIVSNEKLKNDFDMATSHFIVLRDDLNPAEMSDIEDRMEAVKGVTSVVSYHKMLGTGIPDFFIPDAVKDMLKQGGYQLMMVNSSYSPATDAVAAQLDEMNAILKQYDENAMITGEGAMYRDLIDTTAVDFVVANYLSIICIFIIVAWAFKSITVPAVLVATIELAIFLNQGFSYFSGASTPFIAPTIISCVQLGATVDYAILMTSRFQEELQSGKSRKEAIRIAADSADSSIITSALVLFCATLGVSFVSSIDLIGAICIMLARGALISACICLFVMPAVLYVCEPVFSKTTLHWRTPAPKKESKTAKALKAASGKLPARKDKAQPEADVSQPDAASAPASQTEEPSEEQETANV
ncbi:MAG: antibiotic ABC transporter permease, partial [Clostridiales bacterium]|nr:antibiotic ABC transporter permease [Clostridiales bacterium]